MEKTEQNAVSIKTDFDAITDAGTLAKKIKAWGTRGKTMRQESHELAFACLLQAVDHNNITPANDMLKVTPDFMRKNALIKWFTTFGPFKHQKGTLMFVGGKKCNTAKARITPFWKFNEQEGVDFKAFDFKAFTATVMAMGKKLKANEEHGVQNDPLLIEAIQALNAMVAQRQRAERAQEEAKAVNF